MPMGISNAPARFQRLMNQVLGGLDNVGPYVDDILVGSPGNTLEEAIENHYNTLKLTLTRLRDAGLHLAPSKSFLFQEEVQFCGHVLRDGTRRATPCNLKTIEDYPYPLMKKAIRGWLGTTGFYSMYCKNYTQRAACFTEQLTKGGRLGETPER